MKTAYELFRKYEGFDMLDTGETVDLLRFLEALKEHDKERDKIIDNMISKRMKQISPQILDDYIDALTELKELLSNSI